MIDVLRANRVGGAQVESRATWRPGARLWSLPLAASAAARLTFANREALVHVHLAEGGAFVREGGVAVWARLAGRRTVLTIHGADFLPFARRCPRLVAWVLRRGHLVTCLDAEVAERISELAPAVPVEVLANPVRMDDSSPPADLTSEVALFAGEISERKGADVLARAWATVHAARPGARLLLAGPPRDVDVQSADGLELLGPVERERMVELLREARVVVLPSRAEGMPMILTEAMSAGRPFISTPVGAIGELARGGGVLVPVGDPDALAEALISLLADPSSARRIGERAREYCRATRSVEVIDRRLGELYDRVEDASR